MRGYTICIYKVNVLWTFLVILLMLVKRIGVPYFIKSNLSLIFLTLETYCVRSMKRRLGLSLGQLGVFITFGKAATWWTRSVGCLGGGGDGAVFLWCLYIKFTCNNLLRVLTDNILILTKIIGPVEY